MSKPTAPQARFLTAIVDGHPAPMNVVGDWRPINTCKANGWVLAVPAEGGRVTWEITPEGRSAIGLDATMEAAPLLIGKGQNGKGAEAVSETDPELREKLAALAALEEYNGESCGNASHNLRSVLSGDYDPRPDARRHGLDAEAFDDGMCSCEAYDCRGECCGAGQCSCTPAIARAVVEVREAIPVPTPEEFRARLRAMSGTPAMPVPAPLYYLATDAQLRVHLILRPASGAALCGELARLRRPIANGDVSRVDCLACLDRYVEEVR